MKQELSKDNIEKIKEWQVKIDDLRLENNMLRDSLAKAIREEVSASFLEETEDVHQKLMDLDQVTALMRHEIVHLLSHQDVAGYDSNDFQLLQLDIERCEKEFRLLETFFKRLIL